MEKVGYDGKLPFTDFIANGVWDVHDVLRPIYEDASEAYGREFPYPADANPQ